MITPPGEKQAFFQILRVWSGKGRLQHHIRTQVPKAFKGNYSIKSVGLTKLDVVQHYLDSYLEHHKMADLEVQAKLGKYQVDHPQANPLDTRLWR